MKSAFSLLGLILVFFACGAEVQAATPDTATTTVPDYTAYTLLAFVAVLTGRIAVLEVWTGFGAATARRVIAGLGIFYGLNGILASGALALTSVNAALALALSAYSVWTCGKQFAAVRRLREDKIPEPS